MQLYDALSAEERNYIKEYIENFGGVEGSETSVTVPLEYILRFWDKNKEPLYDFFGHQLILEKEIDIKRPESILHEDMEAALYHPDGIGILFVEQFHEWVGKYCREDWLKYSDLSKLIDIAILVNNIYIGDNIEIAVPGSNHPLQIQSGCKAMKMLAKIAKAFNLEGFEEFRIKHSMVLNQKRFKGTLCLSIHPLDFMTMSDNNCEWESCMSWKQGGEYRLGTVEMMNSPNIIVAYLKAEKDMDLFSCYGESNGEVRWNNKRWRELFVVSPDMLMGIKGYPFNDDNLSAEVLEWLLELAKKNTNYSYFPKEYKVKNKTTIDIEGLNFLIDLTFNAMYNDIYSRHPAYFGTNIFKHGDGLHLLLSGETECMVCGENWTSRYSDFDTESLRCPECTGVRYCPECGDYVDLEDMVDLDDGTCMCRWCAERYATQCEGCYYTFRKNSVTEVFLRHVGAVDLGMSICLCDDCLENKNLETELGPIEYKRKSLWSLSSKVYQVDSKNFTPEGFHRFGIYGDEMEDMLEEIAEEAGEA